MSISVAIAAAIYVLGLLLCPITIRKVFKHLYFPILYFYTNCSSNFQIEILEASTSILITIIIILGLLILILSYFKYIDHSYEKKLKSTLTNMEIAFRKIIIERDHHQKKSGQMQTKIDLLNTKFKNSKLEKSALQIKYDQLQTENSKIQNKLIQLEHECGEKNTFIDGLLKKINILEEKHELLLLKVEEDAANKFQKQSKEKNSSENIASTITIKPNIPEENKTKTVQQEVDFLFSRAQQISDARKAGAFSNVNLMNPVSSETVSEVKPVIPYASIIKEPTIQSSYQKPNAKIKPPFLFLCRSASKDLFSYVKTKIPRLNSSGNPSKRKPKSIFSVAKPQFLDAKY